MARIRTMPAASCAAKKGSRAAPASARMANADGQHSLAEHLIQREPAVANSTASGSSMALWTLNRKIPPPAISVPSTMSES